MGAGYVKPKQEHLSSILTLYDPHCARPPVSPDHEECLQNQTGCRFDIRIPGFHTDRHLALLFKIPCPKCKNDPQGRRTCYVCERTGADPAQDVRFERYYYVRRRLAERWSPAFMRLCQ